MRLLLIAFACLSIGSLVSAAYSSKTVENYKAYAQGVSHTFAKGDSGDGAGWRECVELENNGENIGMACEGIRSLALHNGRMVDVNYYCEFRFRKKGPLRFLVESEACQ